MENINAHICQFSRLESAAADAAIDRARTGRTLPSPRPEVHSASTLPEQMADVLRHRLRLTKHAVTITRRAHPSQPLFAEGGWFRAVVLRIEHDDTTLDFLGSYARGGEQVVFDVIAPCPACGAPVPSEEVNSLEDLGDFLLEARDTLGGSARFRRSPAHHENCAASGD